MMLIIDSALRGLPRVCARLAERRRQSARACSRRAMLMTASGGSRCQSLLLCVDFDQTITTDDSIHLLFDAAAAALSSAQQRDEHHNIVDKLVEMYMSELSTVTATLSNCNTDASTRSRRFDPVGLHQYLAMYAKVDMQSIQRVIRSGALRGIRHDELLGLGQNIEIMDNCLDALAAADRVRVVSSNWSSVMIEHALHHAKVSHQDFEVIANELEVDSDGYTTGAINLQVQSPYDKGKWLRESHGVCIDHVTVFIGDSTNDLLGLVAADVGIAISSSAESSFTRACHAFGVKLDPLSASETLQESVNKAADARHRGSCIVFTADGWDTIRAVLSRDRATKVMA